MINFKPNIYIEIFFPQKKKYLPVRIIEKTENGYNALTLENNTEFKIDKYWLNAIDYRTIQISENILSKLGFTKDALKYKLNDIIIIDGLITDIKKIDHPNYLYDYSSSHLGFAILKNSELPQFREDYKTINFNDKVHPIKDKYFFCSNINDLFSKLQELEPDKFSSKSFDEAVVENINTGLYK